MPKVKFVVENHEVEIPAGTSLRSVALEAGINPNREYFRGLSCGGRGLCGSCLVWIAPATDAAVSQPTIREWLHGAGRRRRLACQARVLGDLQVTTLAGGDDRTATGREISVSPSPLQDALAPRKANDEAPSISHPLGHPSCVGLGASDEAANANRPVLSSNQPAASSDNETRVGQVAAPEQEPATGIPQQ